MSDRQAIANFLRCKACPLHNTGLCSALDDDHIHILGRLARRRRVPKGSTLTREGEKNPEVHNIVTGLVKLTKLLPDGREQIVGLMHPSDFIGCTFQKSCEFSAEAVTEVELCSFDKPAFEAALRGTPELEHAFLMNVISELQGARQWMVLLGCKTGLERVATFLWFLIARSAKQGCCKERTTGEAIYEIPVSRTDISLCIGLSMETVSRQISHLNTLGVIELVDSRHFKLRDRDRLVEISGLSEEEAGDIAC